MPTERLEYLPVQVIARVPSALLAVLVKPRASLVCTTSDVGVCGSLSVLCARRLYH
jgi:hypothetical protein